MSIENLSKLREPFPAHQISKLPKPTKAQTEEVKADFKKGIRCEICGTWHHPKVVHLDYVGHAALTDRLLDTDPLWSWEPMALDTDGLPRMDKNGGMWIRLTVCGVTRPGYGNAEGKTGGDAVKEIIGDALRNAAMRFGAALDLWHKGDLHADDDPTATPQPPAETRPMGWDVPSLEEFEAIKDRAYSAFKAGGMPEEFNKFKEKWQACRNNPENTSESVLVRMEEATKKLEEAAKKKEQMSKAAAKKEVSNLGLSA